MFERHGEITPPWGDPWVGRCRRPSSRTPAFNAGFQPFVDHPSNDAVRESLVEEVPQMAVVDRVEVTLNVDIDTPPHTGAHAGGAQSVERLVSRAAGPEAIRAGEEVLLVD